MTTLERFNAEYEVMGMNKNSLTLRNHNTQMGAFIHRNAYNALLKYDVEDFREVERTFENGRGSRWVEVLAWISI